MIFEYLIKFESRFDYSKMSNVRRILNFDHSEQNLINQPNLLDQPNMSEQYSPIELEEYKRIAEAKDNFSN